MPSPKRLLPALAAAALAAGLGAPAALASTTQQSILEDDGALHANPAAALATMKSLGVTTVKVAVFWNTVAPDPNAKSAPKHFTASNPADYPAGNWSFLDTVDRLATADGLKVGFLLTEPAPKWATGSGAPSNCSKPCGNWKPNPADFGAFVDAVGRRYDGGYAPSGSTDPLPRVSWWSIWNEPNYGPDLAPQATNGNTVPTAAIQYRALLSHAWNALKATGHTTAHDTILIGETAPRGRQGRGFPGTFSGTVPITFLQELYCVNGSERRLSGAAASRAGCGASAASFRAQNPALFDASGFADHPYAQGTPPNVPTYACGASFCFNTRTKRSDSGYADFAVLGRLESTLDRAIAADGGHTHYSIWNTEYGYWTNPPDHEPHSLSIATAELYMNWAEYLSYGQPRVASYDQYLLFDPPSGEFGSGLETASGQRTTYDAFQVPLYMPTTSATKPTTLTVWGAARPAPFATDPQVAIQFAPRGGSFSTIATPTVNSRGYFDVRQAFTQSGTVRIAFSSLGSGTAYSRTQAITIK